VASGCPKGWQLVKLGDLGEVNRGRSRHRPRYAEHLYGGPYPFVQTGDIRESGGRITSYKQTYSESGLAQSRMWPSGTMCITIAANIAETAILTFPACFPDSIVGFVADESKCEVRFVEYMFRFLKRRIQHEASGSVQDNINLGTLDRLWFPLPPLTEQRIIVHILGTLDDKIELNRRMNATLEGMARTIFKSWFVDFDPVGAKAAELCDEGILEIGDGYRAKNSEFGAEGLPFARAGNLNSGFDLEGADRLCLASVAKAASKISQHGDVAFTSKGTVGRIARVDESAPQFVYAPQVCFWRSKNRTKLHPAVLYCWMSSDDFAGQVRSFSGQTDMAPYISLSDQRRILVPRFPESQIELGDRIDILVNRKALCVRESRSLATVRDALLPRLLSGKLSLVKETRFHGNTALIRKKSTAVK